MEKTFKKILKKLLKQNLQIKKRILYSTISILSSFVLYLILVFLHDQSPVMDSLTAVFSVIGLILTVKRCIEQWYVWFVVNGLSTIMWINAYLHGSNCFATILMWATYFVLSIYFLITWKRELK